MLLFCGYRKAGLVALWLGRLCGLVDGSFIETIELMKDQAVLEKQYRNVSVNLTEQSPIAVKKMYCKPALSLIRVDPRKKPACEVLESQQAEDLDERRKRWVYRIKREIDQGVYDIEGKLDASLDRLIVCLG